MATITGTAGNDTLTGTAEADTLTGLAGNDILLGQGGNDSLDGGTGADNLIGGVGDDTYVVDDAGDQVVEGTGEGDDTVETSINYTLAANVENLIGTGSAGLTLTGNALANAITGSDGNDVLSGGVDELEDTLAGGEGDDTYIVRGGTDDLIEEAAADDVEGIVGGNDTVLVVASTARTAYELQAGVAVENLIASDATSTRALDLTGNEFAQTIVGNAGANELVGGGGEDTLIGLGGNDTYVVSSADVSVVEAASGGNDTALLTADAEEGDYSFANVETIDASAATGEGINLAGGAGDQEITGNAEANMIDGGAGDDTLIGGLGDDTYMVDSLDDVVTEAAGEGTDRVTASSSYALASESNVEVFTAAGTDLTATVGQGNGTLNLNALNTTVTSNYFVGDVETSQIIFGDAGSNILNGRTGDGEGGEVDTLVGGAGDDIYRVYTQGDVVVEDTGGGNDTVYTSANYSLALNDTAARAAAIGSRTGADYLGATAPSQIENLVVADAKSETDLTLVGNAYGQIIVGNYGDNTIASGGVGTGQIDQLAGLLGDDIYDVTGRNTTVNENVGEGTDTVLVNLDETTDNFFSLIPQAEVEYLIAAGENAINLQGSSFAQVITGNSEANTILGGGGADTLVGGSGSDNYVVDSQDLQIVEALDGAGVDTVFASVSYDLAQEVDYTPFVGADETTGEVGVEVLSTANQSGTEAINLIGNGFAQTLIGNYGNNILNGDNDTVDEDGVAIGTTAGDTLVGLFGDDIYRVYSQNDVVVENAGEGVDAVFTSGDYSLAYDSEDNADPEIETLSAADQSSTVGLALTGNAFGQTIIGTNGEDTIRGGEGNDTLVGRGGSDTFVFADLGEDNADTISDFTPGDFIGLEGDAFEGLGGTISSAEFVNGTTAVGTGAQVLYNQTTGELFYDADGTGAGAAELFAIVTPGTALGFNDFTIVEAPLVA